MTTRSFANPHPDHDELAELMRLLRERVDSEIDLAATDAFATFLRELDSIDHASVPTERGQRWQDDVIVKQIHAGSRVLDLGCGDGDLLVRLRREREVRGQGVELSQEHIYACVNNGVPVIQSDIDAGLKDFPDHSFDYVVLEETLQTLHKPNVVLEEMLRVGDIGIVSFPNFAHWLVRLYLAARGRMPISKRLPFRWYDTPNIHHLTLRDFQTWCEEAGATIDQGFVLVNGEVRELRKGDNLDASEALLFVRRT